MRPSLIELGDVKALEGEPGEAFLATARDATLLVEACANAGVGAALLYPENLPAAFFDLSSGQAGEILQKLRNYRVRLAVVCPPGSVRFSSRFGEMVAEERRGHDFGVFNTRNAALEWLGR